MVESNLGYSSWIVCIRGYSCSSSKPFIVENQYYFRVLYGQICIMSVVAHTKWEAIDKAYSKFIGEHPQIVRAKLKAKRIY